jgi:hypothetical protein
MSDIRNSWNSYPSLYALGHRAIAELLHDPVTVEEKIDGSQFSMGVFEIDGERVLKCRSKGAQINTIAPDGMFKAAVETAQRLMDRMVVGWTYRAEYLMKPKHNSLAYDRIPKDHLILFDVAVGPDYYLSYDAKAEAAAMLGLEVVPRIYEGMIEDVQQFRSYLDTVSCLGGQKIEGVVIKNYLRFGPDKKPLFGKFVSEAFKEVHAREWKAANPTQGDILEQIIDSLRTPARWNKAIQHLREAGQLEDSPRDIGLLMKEVPGDVEKEEADFIKQKLWEWAWPHLRRGIVRGLPEFYKERLLEQQFNGSLQQATQEVGHAG